MKIWELLKKNGATIFLGGISLDSYRRQIMGQASFRQELILKSEAEKKAILEAAWNKEEISASFQTKVEISSNAATHAQLKVDQLNGKLQSVNDQLSSGKIQEGNTVESLNTLKTYYESELKNANGQLKEAVNQINDTVVEFVTKNDLGSFISETIEKYQAFLGTLTLEQQVIVFNLIGLISLLYISISLFSMLFANNIIEKLNLQSRFPRLAKYILFRQKMSEYNYITFIIMFYCTGLLWILGNIYMFFLPYFV